MKKNIHGCCKCCWNVYCIKKVRPWTWLKQTRETQSNRTEMTMHKKWQCIAAGYNFWIIWIWVPHLWPLSGSLLGSDSTPLFSVQCTNEWSNRRSTNNVNGNPRFLHSFNYTHVRTTSTEENHMDIKTLQTYRVHDTHLISSAHLAPPPPSTRAILFPVSSRASREKSLCLSAVFSKTFS